MALKFVVGLFQSKGIAEDACNRLKYEGVPASDISLLLLHEVTPLPQAVSAEIEALSVDPLMLGNVRKTYAPYIRNGETAVFVRTHSENEVDLAVATLRQYAPIRIRVTATGEGGGVDHDIL
jgi:hypothetical protein